MIFLCLLFSEEEPPLLYHKDFWYNNCVCHMLYQLLWFGNFSNKVLIMLSCINVWWRDIHEHILGPRANLKGQFWIGLKGLNITEKTIFESKWCLFFMALFPSPANAWEQMFTMFDLSFSTMCYNEELELYFTFKSSPQQPPRTLAISVAFRQDSWLREVW